MQCFPRPLSQTCRETVARLIVPEGHCPLLLVRSPEHRFEAWEGLRAHMQQGRVLAAVWRSQAALRVRCAHAVGEALSDSVRPVLLLRGSASAGPQVA